MKASTHRGNASAPKFGVPVLPSTHAQLSPNSSITKKSRLTTYVVEPFKRLFKQSESTQTKRKPEKKLNDEASTSNERKSGDFHDKVTFSTDKHGKYKDDMLKETGPYLKNLEQISTNQPSRITQVKNFFSTSWNSIKEKFNKKPKEKKKEHNSTNNKIAETNIDETIKAQEAKKPKSQSNILLEESKKHLEQADIYTKELELLYEKWKTADVNEKKELEEKIQTKTDSLNESLKEARSKRLEATNKSQEPLITVQQDALMIPTEKNGNTSQSVQQKQNPPVPQKPQNLNNKKKLQEEFKKRQALQAKENRARQETNELKQLTDTYLENGKIKEELQTQIGDKYQRVNTDLQKKLIDISESSKEKDSDIYSASVSNLENIKDTIRTLQQSYVDYTRITSKKEPLSLQDLQSINRFKGLLGI